uniref:Uncharacterized protein n=1 Tax=Parascaris univalens TaxID=6257 RepID=A0A915B6M9_PARUN
MTNNIFSEVLFNLRRLFASYFLASSECCRIIYFSRHLLRFNIYDANIIGNERISMNCFRRYKEGQHVEV